MKNNMFMALATAILNSVALIFTPLLAKPEMTQAIMALCGLLSPFLSIYLLKLYIKADDPPELVRSMAGLKSSIKICKSHLNDKSASLEFKEKTRRQLEDFQTKLQNVRTDFENGRTHSITSITSLQDD